MTWRELREMISAMPDDRADDQVKVSIAGEGNDGMSADYVVFRRNADGTFLLSAE